jgi:hypothetical protein
MIEPPPEEDEVSRHIRRHADQVSTQGFENWLQLVNCHIFARRLWLPSFFSFL